MSNSPSVDYFSARHHRRCLCLWFVEEVLYEKVASRDEFSLARKRGKKTKDKADELQLSESLASNLRLARSQ